MVEHRIDWERASRTGASEAVLCEPKSPAQIDAIVAHALELSRRLLFTRLAEDKFERLSVASRGALDFEPVSRTAVLGGLPKASGEGFQVEEKRIGERNLAEKRIREAGFRWLSLEVSARTEPFAEAGGATASRTAHPAAQASGVTGKHKTREPLDPLMSPSCGCAGRLTHPPPALCPADRASALQGVPSTPRQS